MNEVALSRIKVYQEAVVARMYRCHYTRKPCGCQLEPMIWPAGSHGRWNGDPAALAGQEVGHSCDHSVWGGTVSRYTTIERAEWV